MTTLRPAFYTDELFVGQTAQQSKTITETDIILFSAVSMDTNAIHLDEEYAKTTRFGTRIVHGMLTGSLISSVLANRLPGPGTIFLSQSMKFLAPVHPGQTITAKVTVTEITKEKNRVRLETICTVEGKRVLEGEAVVLSVAKPAA
ncbi:MAG: MaoC family dehydratase [Burkholderiaceae bacterium]|jgi:3-hydroxybutyryl-CoA dehydratase